MYGPPSAQDFQRYSLSPGSLRIRASSATRDCGVIAVEPGYRQPHCWDEILAFFAAGAVEGIEKIENGKYYPTVHWRDRNRKSCIGWIGVAPQPKRASLVVTIDEFQPGICVKGRSLPGCFDHFELAVRVILEKLNFIKNIRP